MDIFSQKILPGVGPVKPFYIIANLALQCGILQARVF